MGAGEHLFRGQRHSWRVPVQGWKPQAPQNEMLCPKRKQNPRKNSNIQKSSCQFQKCMLTHEFGPNRVERECFGFLYFVFFFLTVKNTREASKGEFTLSPLFEVGEELEVERPFPAIGRNGESGCSPMWGYIQKEPGDWPPAAHEQDRQAEPMPGQAESSKHTSAQSQPPCLECVICT